MESENRYNSYGAWLRRRFGGRIHKVSVEGGFTCPNRDGTAGRGGCSYCSNESFRAASADAEVSVEEQIHRGIGFLSSRFAADRFIVFWQHYTNTYAPVERLKQLFVESLRADPRILGLSIATRADCAEEEKLEMLQELAQESYVCLEYGLESIYDSTLKRIGRGHDFAACEDAVRRTRMRGLPVCAHIILGFPWETRQEMLAYAPVLNDLGIEFLKIHHLHVVKNTRLGLEFLERPFATFSLDEWVQIVCDFLEQLSPDIVIQRLFGWAPEPDLIAPCWGRSRAEVLGAIVSELERRDSRQGQNFQRKH